MPRSRLMSGRSVAVPPRRRSVRPEPEGLEQRLLLYATLGARWTYGSRITYSFMPDGTSVGGTPSSLFQTLNARFATATWQQQLQQAAALWENVAGINLARVSDNGAPVATSGNQQGDSRFGDIRIGAIPLPAGTLAMAFLPPPINGGPAAGDILFNSNVNWQIGSSYDLMTVAAHEIGHALGMDHTQSTNTTAEMYATYNGLKQALTSDDIAGIQSDYGLRQPDAFDSNGSNNNTYLSATNITSWIDSKAQIAIPGLDLTTSSDTDWYIVTVPSSTTGTMTVTVQSSNLSSLAPKLQVYNVSLGLLGQVSGSLTFGATISYAVSGVQAGQSYYFKVMAAGGPAPIGGYGLLVNFGSQPQAPIAPPNTVVAQQPDQGGGTMNLSTQPQPAGGGLPDRSGPGDSGPENSADSDDDPLVTIGDLMGRADFLTVGPVLPRSGFGAAITLVHPARSPGSPAGPIGTWVAAPGLVPVTVLMNHGGAKGPDAASTAHRPQGNVLQALDHALGSWTARHRRRSVLDPGESAHPWGGLSES